MAISNSIGVLNKIYNELLNRDVDIEGIKAYYFFTEKEEDIQKIKESIKKSEEYKNKPFILKENYNSIIPLNLYITWHTKDLPQKMKENVELLKQQNPEFNFFLFDDNDCRNFIQENFGGEVLDAFDTLIPGAYKADLWRYCVLYINGGIYLDIKYHCVNGFKLIALTEKDYFVRDRPEKCLYNALLVTLPKNEIMLKCINKIVENVKNNYYGNSLLSPTGPKLLGSYFSNEYRLNLDLEFNRIENKNSEYICLNNSIILLNYKEYRNELSKEKKLHYETLWNNKNIYYNCKNVKKIHLTCKDKENINNEIWLKCLNQYKKIYTDYEIIIHDNNDIYNIVNNTFPEYLEKIKQIKVGPALADIFRYLILYLEGGIYSDMDCEPLKHINQLLNQTYYHGDKNRNNKFYVYPNNKQLIDNKWDFYCNPCNNCDFICENNDNETYKCLGHNIGNPSTILCYEFHEDWHNKEDFLNDDKWTYNNVGICQWFIISKPKQDIFLKMFYRCMENIDKLIDADNSNPNYHNNIIDTCGPLAFTKLVMNSKSDKICILPSDFFCTGSWNNIVPLTKNSYVKHHFTYSWK